MDHDPVEDSRLSVLIRTRADVVDTASVPKVLRGMAERVVVREFVTEGSPLHEKPKDFFVTCLSANSHTTHIPNRMGCACHTGRHAWLPQAAVPVKGKSYVDARHYPYRPEPRIRPSFGRPDDRHGLA